MIASGLRVLRVTLGQVLGGKKVYACLTNSSPDLHLPMAGESKVLGLPHLTANEWQSWSYGLNSVPPTKFWGLLSPMWQSLFLAPWNIYNLISK